MQKACAILLDSHKPSVIDWFAYSKLCSCCFQPIATYSTTPLPPAAAAAAAAAQIVAYEILLRRLIHQAPNAALLAFEAFTFGSYSVTVAAGGTATMPMPYYNTGNVLVSCFLLCLCHVRIVIISMLYLFVALLHFCTCSVAECCGSM
jgi:hypothetical protein